jgi:hypothetical protein
MVVSLLLEKAVASKGPLVLDALTREDLQVLSEGLSKGPQGVTLVLQDCAVEKEVFLELLRRLPAMVAIESFQLGDLPFLDDECYDVLVDVLPRCATLRLLALHGARGVDKHLPRVLEGLANTHVTDLSLRDIAVNEASVKALSSLYKNKLRKWRALCVRSCYISDDCILQLGRAISSSTLTRLAVSLPGVLPKVVASFVKECARMRCLLYFIMTSTVLWDECADSIALLISSTRVFYVGIEHCSIGKETVNAIGKASYTNMGLKAVSLVFNPGVNADSAKVFRRDVTVTV